MDTDRNLLFGVLALQADLIDARQFVEVCTLWTTRKDALLADLLIERGWLLPADRAHLDYLVERKTARHGGARAGLASVGDEVKRSLAALGDADIQQSLAGLPRPPDDPTATVAHVPEPAQRYRLTCLHASGGIGRVWLAHDRNLGRDVALKELRPEMADDRALGARFLQEARITGQLEHPGIVPVYEVARRAGDQQPYYTMRFVSGRTLTEAAQDYHRRRRAGQAQPLDLVTLLNAFVAVCQTVAYAHSRGVLHRDLKGQNIVLGDFGEVVVLDWGLAKRLDGPVAAELPAAGADDGPEDSEQTLPGQTLGTPSYMAPEQAAGRLDLIDRPTDVYGLGAVLYEILTGRAPFSGTDTAAVLRRVQEEEPVAPGQLWAEVPPALEAICLRALAKRPADRPAAAADLALAVQGWQDLERRKAEEALRESEALYHSLVETLPLNVWRKDISGRFTFANRGFCAAVERSLDEILGRTDFDLFPPPLAEQYRRDDAHVIHTGQTLRTAEEHVTPTGRRLFVEVIKIPIHGANGEVVGTQGIFWDVTERKLVEEELRKSRERFELAVQGSQDGLWDWDLTTDEVYYSPRYKAMLGYEDHEFPNRRQEWASRVHPDDLERVASELRGHFKSRESLSWVEFRFRHKDGSYRWIRSRAFVLRDGNGRVYRMSGSHEDITDRKRAEEELARERHLFGSLMDTTPDKIYFKDRAGHYLRVNSALAEKFGLSGPAEVVGKTVHDVFTAEYAAQADADEREVMRTGQPMLARDVRETWPDGRVTWISTTKVPLRDADGTIVGTIGISRDITERKQAEEALRQALAELEQARRLLSAAAAKQ